MFKISRKDSVELARVNFPISNIILKISVYIIDDDLPILLSLADMDNLGIYFNNLIVQLIQHSPQEKRIVTRSYRHPFVHWDPLQQSFFTYTELKTL